MSHMTSTYHAVRRHVDERIAAIEADDAYHVPEQGETGIQFGTPDMMRRHRNLRNRMAELMDIRGIIRSNCDHQFLHIPSRFVDGKSCIHCGLPKPESPKT